MFKRILLSLSLSAFSLLPLFAQNNDYPVLMGGRNVLAIGDSLTAGNQDGTGVAPTFGSYPGYLSILSNNAAFNTGVGGMTSTQIANRIGAYQPLMTISGGTIPASGGVTVTFASGGEPLTSQGPVGGIDGIAGGIPGKLTLASTTYTFTRYVPGNAVSISTIPFIPKNIRGAFCTMWTGRNDISSAELPANDAAIKNYCGMNYLTMSIINAEGEPSGSANYIQIASDNAVKLANAPNSYLDIRGLLVAGYDPSIAADVIDNSNDIPPYSLRATDITGTITTAITNTTSCPVVSSGVAAPNVILAIESELIYILTTTGNTINTCTRGYASTTATTHLINTALTGKDPLHLGATGYALVARAVFSWLSSHAPDMGQNVITLETLANQFKSPQFVGSVFPSPGSFSNLTVLSMQSPSTMSIQVASTLQFGSNKGIQASNIGNPIMLCNVAQTVCIGYSGNDGSIQVRGPSGGIIPNTDNVMGLGLNGNRWNNLHIGTGATQVDGTFTVSGQPASTGQRFACLTTTGQIVSSATACTGT